jgi:acetate kinase
MRDSVLVLNAGSSSIKFALYPVQGSRLGKRTLGGQVTNIAKSPRIQTHDGMGQRTLALEPPPHAEGAPLHALHRLLDCLEPH